MEGRCRGDAGEMQGRWRGDIGLGGAHQIVLHQGRLRARARLRARVRA